MSPGPWSTTSTAAPGPPVEGRGPDPDLDRAAGRGVGEGVVDQVGQHLAQPLVVAEHDQGAPARVAVAGAQHQLDLAVGGDRPGVVDGLGGQGEQVHRLPVERALLVEPGQQQEVLDQQPHPGRLVLDPPHQAVQLGRVARPALPVQLGEAPDGGQGRAQLVAGVGHEAPHPVLGAPGRLLGAAGAGLGGGPGPEGRLDLGQHGVEGPAEPADLGARVAVGHPAGQVAGGDRPGRLLDLDQRPQAGPDDGRPDRGQGQQHDQAHHQVDQPELAGGAVDAVEAGGHDHAAAVAQRLHGDPPAAVAAGGGHGGRLAGVGLEPGGVVRAAGAAAGPPRGSSLLNAPGRARRRRRGTGPGRGWAARRARPRGPPELGGGRSAERRATWLELVVEAADQVAVEGGHAGQPDQGQGHGDQGEHGHDELDLERGPGGQAPAGGQRPHGHGSGSRRT